MNNSHSTKPSNHSANEFFRNPNEVGFYIYITQFAYPMCCHFGTKRNSRLIGLRQSPSTCPMWLHSLSVSVYVTGSGESIGPHRCVSRRFFGLVLYVRRAMRFNVDIVAFHDVCDTGHTFPEVDTGRTRVNYSYAYAKLPKVFAQFHWRRARTSVVQPEQLCMSSEVRL